MLTLRLMDWLCKTIGRLAQCDGFMLVVCRKCKRMSIRNPRDPGIIGLYERDLASLRYKCSECGERAGMVTPLIPATSTALAKVINGELDLGHREPPTLIITYVTTCRSAMDPKRTQ